MSIERIDSILPRANRALVVTREQFITPQHYQAWVSGSPLRRHLAKRKKFTREERENYTKHLPYRCAEPGCGSTTMLTLDHIVPQIFGGSSTPANLRWMCSPHNRAAFNQYREVLRRIDALAAVAAAPSRRVSA